jgi:hypothetical protein
LLPNRALACRRARPGARFELKKGASRPVAQLDVVIEVKLVVVREAREVQDLVCAQ